MGLIQEKEVRAVQLKDKTLVCPVCATDEEKAVTENIVAEDTIHDQNPMFCVRCQKKIK
jgi:hypothetical protein